MIQPTYTAALRCVAQMISAQHSLAGMTGDQADAEYDSTVIKARAEQSAIDFAGEKGIGKNAEDRERHLVLALARNTDYQIARSENVKALNGVTIARADVDAWKLKAHILAMALSAGVMAVEWDDVVEGVSEDEGELYACTCGAADALRNVDIEHSDDCPCYPSP